MDYAWDHGKKVTKGTTNKSYVMCNYCQHVVQGVTRLKYHLAKVKGIVKVCPKVPKAVQEGFRDNFFPDPYDSEILILKENQKRVPPGEERCSDVASNSHSERSRPTGLVKVAIRRVEKRLRKAEAEVEELKEQLKKLKWEARQA